MTRIAVLTGDLINSTRVQKPEAFTARLSQLLADLRDSYQAEVATFRGDGFQVSLPRPDQAVEAAIYLRAGLIAASPSRRERWDARISVAIAAAEAGQFGQAYLVSGRELDAMDKEHLRLYGEPALFRLGVALATAFVDDTLNRWTPSEAEAYFEYLRTPGGHQAVADRLQKSRPTVTKALLRARYALIDQYRRDTLHLLELTHAG